MSARLVIMGPQGSGKGTQAARLAERLGVPAISTGDIFRANVASGTALGQRAKAVMDAGDLVPDEITNAMVRDRLAEPDAAGGFILDGYPRNAAQVVVLDEALAALGPRSWTRSSSSRPSATSCSPGCASGPRSRVAPTTPRTRSATASRSTPSRPRR